MHTNSIKAYHESSMELSKRSNEVLECLYRMGKGTARQIKKSMGYDDMNMVRPRLTELKDQLWIVEDHHTKCPVTGKTVAVFKPVQKEQRINLIKEEHSGQLALL